MFLRNAYGTNPRHNPLKRIHSAMKKYVLLALFGAALSACGGNATVHGNGNATGGSSNNQMNPTITLQGIPGVTR
jgi:hypothetical protein